MTFLDILKISAVIVGLVVGIINIYKFFRKPPSEQENTVIHQKADTITSRFIALFESHGVHRNQITEQPR